MGIKHKTIIVAVRNQEKEDAKICLTLRNALGYKTGRKKSVSSSIGTLPGSDVPIRAVAEKPVFNTWRFQHAYQQFLKAYPTLKKLD